MMTTKEQKAHSLKCKEWLWFGAAKFGGCLGYDGHELRVPMELEDSIVGGMSRVV